LLITIKHHQMNKKPVFSCNIQSASHSESSNKLISKRSKKPCLFVIMNYSSKEVGFCMKLIYSIATNFVDGCKSMRNIFVLVEHVKFVVWIMFNKEERNWKVMNCGWHKVFEEKIKCLVEKSISNFLLFKGNFRWKF